MRFLKFMLQVVLGFKLDALSQGSMLVIVTGTCEFAVELSQGVEI